MCSKSSHSGEPQCDVLAAGMCAVTPLPLPPLLSTVPLPATTATVALAALHVGRKLSVQAQRNISIANLSAWTGRRQKEAMTVITRSVHLTQWLRAESELTRKSIYEICEEEKVRKKIKPLLECLYKKETVAYGC